MIHFSSLFPPLSISLVKDGPTLSSTKVRPHSFILVLVEILSYLPIIAIYIYITSKQKIMECCLFAVADLRPGLPGLQPRSPARSIKSRKIDRSSAAHATTALRVQLLLACVVQLPLARVQLLLASVVAKALFRTAAAC
jgi:hypothetical protein